MEKRTVVDGTAVAKASESLDVLASAVIAHDETLKRQREASIELLKEIQDKFGPLMLRFKQKIEDAAPTLIQKHSEHPGGLMDLRHGYSGDSGIFLSGFNCHVSTTSGAAACSVKLGWDGKLVAGGKHVFDGSDPDIHVDYQFDLVDPKAFVASIIADFKRKSDEAVKVLSDSEARRAKCLAAAAEIRRVALWPTEA